MKILALNPRPKKKKSAPASAKKKKPAKKKPAKKKGATMAAKKKTTKKKAATRGKGKSRRKPYKKNPSAQGILSGTALPAAARSMVPMNAGALIAKVCQKRFGDGTSEDGNWTWKDYIAGGIGTFVGSLASRHLLRSTASTQQKVLEGGLLILTFKLITQEVVPMSKTVEEWLGDDEQMYQVGQLYQTADGAWHQLGEDGNWNYVPKDAVAELMRNGGYVGASNEPISPPGRLGAAGNEPISPPGRLGDEGAYEEAWGAQEGRGALW